MIKIAVLAFALFATSVGATASPAHKIPVIVDTDIGTDIDDAYALALVIKSPELDLLGVTTVSGDSAARARIAAKLLWQEGGQWRRVPVVAGESGTPAPSDQVHWADGFTSPQLLKESAVDFLRNEIRRHSGQITLIAIGKLTNVAALIKADPLTARKIRRIVLMGGSIARDYTFKPQAVAEMNIKLDPAAARTVFSSGIPIIMAPLDVTVTMKLDATDRNRIFAPKTPLAVSLLALYKLWNQETPTLFDPMAVALVLNPRLSQTQRLAITVDDQGYTRVVKGGIPNATVAIQADPAKFMKFYVERVAQN
jgi:inosine-uridine nucleoside N-ribohydrolase